MYVNFFRYVWQHSRREQIIVLFYVVASLPFYWWSLDVPKRIVNEAIQGSVFSHGQDKALLFKFTVSLPNFLGGYSFDLSDGWMLSQLPYLLALSLLFLVLTLINGWFKYVINIRKGILGERMLRRLRFELFSMVMRFRPEDVRTTKSAEVTSMIKDEVEPIGGFFGEAFITPAFLGTQAITAMAFILVQNMWLGTLALSLIVVQGIVIPHLRREQIRLGRMRQLESRVLAGRIGEMIEAAPALHAYGVTRYSGAEIGQRLGTLFDIRLRLYRRKFAVKYLNNLLAQLTPFIFYTLGGYLALQGRLDIGQLVAVIAAYRDLPTPIKELIDWDQQRNDVTVKYEQVVGAFAKDFLLDNEPEEDPTPVAPDAPITAVGLRVVSGRGLVQIDRMSAAISRPGRIAIVGPAGSGRDILPKVIGRQITDYQGSITLGGHELSSMSDRMASATMLYVSGEPYIMSGTIRDNLVLALRRALPTPEDPKSAFDRYWRDEALKTDNPVVSPDIDWVDYGSLGLSGPDELDAAIIQALRVVDGYDDIFRVGLSSRLGSDLAPDVAERMLNARGAILAHYAELGIADYVESFQPKRFNTNATIGENLLFGVSIGQRFTPENLPYDPFVRSIISAEALSGPLTTIGLKMVETVAEAFQGLAANNPLRERYSFVDDAELNELWPKVESSWQRGQRRQFPAEVRDKLIGYALMYVEPQHRLNLIDDRLVERVLRARRSFRQFLPAQDTGEIEFYDTKKLMPGATIRDNLLFGRIRYGKAHARDRLVAGAAEVLTELGLESFVVSKGLDQEAGPGGRLLSAPQRATVQLARATLRHPDILILDDALSSFGASEAHMIMNNILEAMAGKTVIVTQSNDDDVSAFDQVLTFEGAKLVGTERAAPAAEPADEAVEAADEAAGPAEPMPERANPTHQEAMK
ncbi:ABC transporter transmembrane domain-containing protein [Ancylobacter mangrovi]|uniref:ABC transporter transmembrane domain-containing protein n=1 Tax=Ancylobacter mangrovi TaxID=2972472 RepID=UPI0021625FD7|nr:ABC transporter transmembrane domain-containing protein [Ancylobacter mangrovi]MCS0503440.1 ABC transporter transmembrane domain-containing protein [Ancylobacter mangrovi]